LDDLLEIAVNGLNLLLVSMTQALMPEEEFLLGDGEVLVCLVSNAHKEVHLVGVG
jgi:hypothetical protein